MAERETPNKRLIDREDAVFVLIDAQERLLPVIWNRETVVENMIRLIKFSKIVNIPIVFTEQAKLGPTIPEIKGELQGCVPIEKVHFNCFLNETFNTQIETLGRKTIIISGVEAHICVSQTAIHASQRFNVHVIADATSSRVEENKRIALERMAKSDITISSTEMFIYEILKIAGTDEFKTALQLVK